jgi:predicted TIM-barrel fold metal-dependent hydrolase
VDLPIVDAQIHSWIQLTSPFPDRLRHWAESYDRSPSEPFTVESVLTSMDAVGVAAAVLHVLGADYMQEIRGRAPDRIAFLQGVTPCSETEAEDVIRAAATASDIVGVRVSVLTDEQAANACDGVYEPLLAAAEHHGVPVFAMLTEHLTVAEPLVRAHPDLTFVIDHLGLPQPPTRVRDEPPFKRLGELLALAQHPNVLVKFIGGPAYSDERYPFADIWPPLRRVIDEFGASRLMWGSDFTRFWGTYTYSELVAYLLYTNEVSEEEKEWMFSRTIRERLCWPVDRSDDSPR